jgi:L-ascorbate metabolism protein UlaG (beta-lactamase superfamily)
MRNAIALLVTFSATALSLAQDTQQLKLRWYGQSMFQLETSAGKKVVFDPHGITDIGRTIVAADVVVCSHLHTDHTAMGAIQDPKAARIFYGLEQTKKGRPAEWKAIDEKVGQIRVRNVGTFHDNQDGLSRGKNSAFVIEADGVTFCHLGDLGHELSEAQVKAIGSVDVLMIPVGGVYTINGETAKKVMAQIKPKRFTLPMHYGFPGYEDLLPTDEFLEGQKNVQKLMGNELTIPIEVKEPTPAVVLLQLKR